MLSTKPVKLLDVGCGPVSILPLWLRTLGHEVWACDLRPTKRTIPGVKFIQADITKSDEIPCSAFDVVTCISVWEHVGMRGYVGESAEPIAFLRALKERMMPNGSLVLTFPFGRSGYSASGRVDTYRVISQSVLESAAAAVGLAILRQDCFRLVGGVWESVLPSAAAEVDSTQQVKCICGVILGSRLQEAGRT